MIGNRLKESVVYISAEERRRRKREIIMIVAIIAIVALLTYAETRVNYFGVNIPISNAVLMFILININLLLLILLLFLVFRNLVKLLYDRRRKVMGAKLRTRLVVAFVALTLLPSTVLFFFSINFITTSIKFWFNVPVEQALENSLALGHQLYSYVEENNLFLLKKAADRIDKKKYLLPENRKQLSRYVQVVQREFNPHLVEIYDKNFNRIDSAQTPQLIGLKIRSITADNLQKDITSKKYGTLTDSIQLGEIARTYGTIPFGVGREEAQAYIAIGALISPTLAAHLKSISKGVADYRQIKLLKRPIQITYYITLTIVAFLVVFCAIWFGFYLAKSITIPIMELAEGTRRVAEGDLSFNIALVADDEIGSLVDSFNTMTRDLRIGREQLERSAKMLRQQNIEIEKSRQYMEIVLKNVSAGVISLNANGLITTINKSVEKMLNLKGDDILNKSYKILLQDQHLNLAGEVMEQFTINKTRALERTLRLTVDGKPKSFMLHLNSLRDDMGRHIGIVMVIDDLTELEKAQRMVAWREVARRIAHEVKNPLTPISLSAQRLSRKYSSQIGETIFDECTRTIIDHVELIRNIVNEFSAFARFPGANPTVGQLPPIIEETVALYREGHTNIRFGIHIEEQIPPLPLDRQQIKQALINIVDNAVSALGSKGEIDFTVSHDPILKMVRLEIVDNGAGISDTEKTRLFEPYFSTKKTGMGLGLSIVSTIISDHNGLISVQDNQPQGAKFVIELPVH